ncbi:hypothetical protein P7K49_009166 [Saguinus oedipus]|uniref:Basic proline-rich protein-like n=1 Tax=Saguinus oedipus TaxID=9490 RepID=A0ABQ9VJT7_SAGOE|nr:hypothetical protein P7K49_009166 [Saguinus oedipus]
MTGRDALSDSRTRSRALVPGGSRRGSRPRGFAITDLLGLEADLPAPAGPEQGSGCEGPAAARCPGPGLDSSSLERGALPLGLGLLCGFSAQPPAAARAPCLLLTDVPFLPPRGPEPVAPQAPSRPPALGRQKRSESVSTSGNQAPPLLPRSPRLRAAQGHTPSPHYAPGPSGPDLRAAGGPERGPVGGGALAELRPPPLAASQIPASHPGSCSLGNAGPPPPGARWNPLMRPWGLGTPTTISRRPFLSSAPGAGLGLWQRRGSGRPKAWGLCRSPAAPNLVPGGNAGGTDRMIDGSLNSTGPRAQELSVPQGAEKRVSVTLLLCRHRGQEKEATSGIHYA